MPRSISNNQGVFDEILKERTFKKGELGTGQRFPGGKIYPNQVQQIYLVKTRAPFPVNNASQIHAFEVLFNQWVSSAIQDLQTTAEQNAPVITGVLQASQRYYGRDTQTIGSPFFATTAGVGFSVIVEIVAVQYTVWVRRYQNYRRYGRSGGNLRDWLSGSINNTIIRSPKLTWELRWRRL